MVGKIWGACSLLVGLAFVGCGKEASQLVSFVEQGKKVCSTYTPVCDATVPVFGGCASGHMAEAYYLTPVAKGCIGDDETVPSTKANSKAVSDFLNGSGFTREKLESGECCYASWGGITGSDTKKGWSCANKYFSCDQI